MQRPGRAGALFGIERTPKQHADHEALGAVVEVVDVDDRDLMIERHRVLVGSGHIGSHQVLDVARRTVQPAQERVDGAHRDGPAGPRTELAVVGEHTLVDHIDQLVEVTHDLAVEGDGARHRIAVIARRLLQLGSDVVHDHRVLLTVVFGIGEQERQQQLLAEVVNRPEEAAHSERATGDVGSSDTDVVASRRGPHPDAGEPVRRQAERAIPLGLIGRKCPIGMVEEEQVFALHVEHECLRVDRLGAEHPGVEQPVQQEGGVRGLGGDT